MDYNSGNISQLRIDGKDYSIKDEPLRSSFAKLSEVMQSNHQEISDFMNSSEMANSYLSYNLNSATSFIYAFSEICINHISKLYDEIAYLKNNNQLIIKEVNDNNEVIAEAFNKIKEDNDVASEATSYSLTNIDKRLNEVEENLAYILSKI